MKKYLFPCVIMLATVLVVAVSLKQVWTYPEQHQIKNFPLLEQPNDITCGPTSATMLLKYYGKEVTLDEVKEKSRTKWFEFKGKDIGMTSPDMLPYALSHFGLPARSLTGNIDKLKYYISQDRPPIVLLRSGYWTWHYVVAIGYDKKHIWVADPASGKRRKMAQEAFSGAWQFSTDMRGQSLAESCPACNGKGSWMSESFGPLSRCELCQGTGRKDDPLSSALRFAEVHSYMMVVPNNSSQ